MAESDTAERAGPGLSSDLDRITRDFTRLYFDLRDQTLGRTRWLGISVVKTPMDMVVLQEIVAETRPELIIETGVFAGGSAYYSACLLDLLRIDGKVIGVDVDLSPVRPHIRDHPRIELIEGSSTDPKVIARLREAARGKRVMVDLDADHRAEHVLAELRALAPLVTPGCYLIVEDTWLGGSPVHYDETRGPAEALAQWMADGQPFEADRWRERFLLTGNPGGYLRRSDPSGTEPPGPPRLESFELPGLDAGETVGGEHAELVSARSGDEQRLRSAHEAEYNRLRAYASQLKEELEEHRAALREKDRLLAEGRQRPRWLRRSAGGADQG